MATSISRAALAAKAEQGEAAQTAQNEVAVGQFVLFGDFILPTNPILGGGLLTGYAAEEGRAAAAKTEDSAPAQA